MPSTPSPRFHPGMTVLDVLAAARATETVFRRAEAQAGECLLCHCLFDTLADIAARYHLDLPRLLTDLEAAAALPPD